MLGGDGKTYLSLTVMQGKASQQGNEGLAKIAKKRRVISIERLQEQVGQDVGPNDMG